LNFSVTNNYNYHFIFDLTEILWGYRFEPLVSFKKELGEYAVDYSLFNSFYEVDTPLCSAEELEDLQNYEKDMKRQGNSNCHKKEGQLDGFGLVE
jgi:hypothetical protein